MTKKISLYAPIQMISREKYKNIIGFFIKV